MTRHPSERFSPPAVVRQAAVPGGALFFFAGRPLRVVKVYGDDAAAPVIVEEWNGQFALWAVDGVARAMGRR